MDIVGYLIFINLLVNHIKIILLKIDSLHKFSLKAKRLFCSHFSQFFL